MPFELIENGTCSLKMELKPGPGEGRRQRLLKKNAEDAGKEKMDTDGADFTSENRDANWSCPGSDGMVTVRKFRPKLCSSRAVCLSSEDSTHSPEPETKHELKAPWEALKSEPGSCDHPHPDQNQAAHVAGEKVEDGKRNRMEEGMAEKRDEQDVGLGEDVDGKGPRRRIANINVKVKEVLKVRRMKQGGMHGGEGERADCERRKRWTSNGREAKGLELKEESETEEVDVDQDGAWAPEVEHGQEGLPDGKMGSVSHTFLSHMLMNSSASSSSSSFSYASDESEEVFSEKEDTATRRQKMRKVSKCFSQTCTAVLFSTVTDL